MRVLFVDDDRQTLRGVTRMMELEAADWEIASATSGEDALRMLADVTFDVLVTDMCMPGMNGGELLDRVCETHPSVLRIVLSGQADKDSVLRAIKPMHQYLTKPCAPAALKSAVARAKGLHQLLNQRELRETVGRIHNLPTAPVIYREVMDLIGSPNGNARGLGQLIAKDPAVTAKLLQLANSSLFQLPRHVNTPEQAVMVLGFDFVRSIVLSTSVFRNRLVSHSWFSHDALSEHSVEVASAARRIAIREGADKLTTDDAFSAALLHDVGKIVLLDALPDKFQRAVEMSRTQGIPLHAAELELFGCSHAAVGAYLLQLWGLPQSIVEAVGFHHSLEMLDPMQAASPMFFVFAANWLVGEAELATLAGQLRQHFDVAGTARVVAKFELWQADCHPETLAESQS